MCQLEGMGCLSVWVNMNECQFWSLAWIFAFDVMVGYTCVSLFFELACMQFVYPMYDSQDAGSESSQT